MCNILPRRSRFLTIQMYRWESEQLMSFFTTTPDKTSVLFFKYLMARFANEGIFKFLKLPCLNFPHLFFMHRQEEENELPGLVGSKLSSVLHLFG